MLYVLFAVAAGLHQVSSFQTTSQLFRRGAPLLPKAPFDATATAAATSSYSSYSALLSSAVSSSTDVDIEEIKEEGVGAWIPLASIIGLTGLGPQRITVMGIDIVVWHTAPNKENGEEMVWSAQVDACTHRLAPLSQGRVNPDTNCIECPYHGWQFGTDGKVTCIPQLEKTKTIESVQKSGGNAKTFPVHAVGDLLFVFLPSSLHGEMFPQSLLPENWYPNLGERANKEEQMFARDLPYSMDFLVENFMDPAHIPFAHHKLQSTRDDGIPIKMAEILSNFTHVEASFQDITGKRPRDAYASFQRPSYYHYGEYTGEGVDEATGKKARKAVLGIYIAPISGGKCRVFFSAPPIKVPVAVLHAGSNRFLNSDTWLHDTEREVVKRKEAGAGKGKLAEMDYIYASQSDTGVSVFRKWWMENGMADAPPNTFAMATMEELGPNVLSRREQIDPWENHAKHCSTCRKSLKNIRRGQTACLFLAIASTVLGRRIPVLGLVGAGVSLYGHNFLKRFATVIEGNPEKGGVGDRSAAAAAD